MRITKVTYVGTFPVAQFLNDKVGLEIELNPGESATEALTYAKSIATEWHKDANPQLQSMEDAAPNIPSATPLKEINLTEEKIEIAIDNANTLEELAEIKKNGFPVKLISHYAKRVKELSNAIR